MFASSSNYSNNKGTNNASTSQKQLTPTTPSKSLKENAPPVIEMQQPPVEPQQNVAPTVPTPPPNTTPCNGSYYTACPAGEDFRCPTNGGGAYCQPSQQQLEAQAAAEAQMRYQTQYQAVQEKIQPLQSQLSGLQSQTNQMCSGNGSFEGSTGVECTYLANQETYVGQYENAILADFITPVTNTSISYENELDNLYQQIFQVKMNYAKQIYGINSRGGISMQEAIGEEQNAATAANTQITAIDQQIQTVLLEYKQGITP
ncbi:hypothetical protein M1432_00995 [Patescibacteria group bacterium]|nr:hypothetical protein [Patescibacteria group bacterium]